MFTIHIEHQPSTEYLAELGVNNWLIWTKEASSFPWHYDGQEICYLLEGAVTVTPQGGEEVHLSAGDLVTFPAGMSCHWTIHQAVRKHYRFG